MLRSAVRDGAFIAPKTFPMMSLNYEKNRKSNESLLNFPPWDLIIVKKPGCISTAAVMAIGNFGFIPHFYKRKILPSEIL